MGIQNQHPMGFVCVWNVISRVWRDGSGGESLWQLVSLHLCGYVVGGQAVCISGRLLWFTLMIFPVSQLTDRLCFEG